ncbi:MAG: DEAD/DEAH box helicase, partial [Chlamydiia bacterium]
MESGAPLETRLAIVEVALDQALDRLLDYRIPEHLIGSVSKGDRLEVPLRGRMVRGYAMGLKESSPFETLQPIQRVCNGDISLPKDLLELANWISAYYCCPLSKALKQMVPSPVRSEMGEKQQLFVTRVRTREELAEIASELRRTRPQQALVLDVLLKTEKGMLLTELLERAGVSRSPVDRLVTARHIDVRVCSLDRSPLQEAEYFLSGPKKLKVQQQAALDVIQANIEDRSFAVHLLHGITGSGKTEVYLQAMDATLKQGRTVLLMVPEIALTTQAVERFRARFPNQAAILHHRLSDGERYDQWQKLRRGELRVAIGARSVVYAPLQDLGLIVVDEEHETSYKSSEEPCVHARDVAIVRARNAGACIILGTATPSLESMTHALSGKYRLHRLDERAEASSNLPKV